jgi:carbamoyl-phosphate synthase large subunit
MCGKKLKPLKILLTACGCPGASTLIRMLKNVGERKIKIIGTDMDKEAVGRFFCDNFYTVPSGSSGEYIPEIFRILKREKPDIIFPESSNEVIPLSETKKEFESMGVKVLVSSTEALQIASNKFRMYEELSKKTRIKLPRYRDASSFEEFLEALDVLDYPNKPVVFKPHVGKGSRGVRIIDPRVNRMDQLLNFKPISKFISLKEFKEIFQNVKPTKFPRLLVMEYLEGMEKTTDSLTLEGRELLTTVKTVERARWGVIVNGELVKEEALVEQTRKILEIIPLSYCVNIQFIGNKLIEINPRVSTFIYQEDLILPYLAIKVALDEINDEGVMSLKKKIDYGRRMVRYMDQIFHKSHKKLL